MSRTKIINQLKEVLASKDSVLFDNLIFEYEQLANDEEVLYLLVLLFEEDWHHGHEDLATLFQICKNPIAVDALYRNTFREFEYLSWNENKPLQRKCTWALADIGTNKVKQYLIEISQSEDEVIASFAKKRLHNWEKELNRKRSN